MKNRKLLFVLMVVLSGYLTGYGQIIKYDFGTTAGAITGVSNYTVAPAIVDTNLASSSFSWTNSVGNFSGSIAAASGVSLGLTNSSGTPTYTFTFTVPLGYQVSITSFDFWRRRSPAGAQNWAMTVAATNLSTTSVGSGTVPTIAAALGTTTVSNAVNSMTGTVTVVLSLSGASGLGNFSLDDFTLNGSVTKITRTTANNGDWYNTATWTGGVVPSSSEDVIINHVVTNVTGGANIVRNAGTSTTVNGSLATGAFSYTNSGATTIAGGTFIINNSGSATGTDFIYTGASTLNIGTPITISGANTAWPASNSPFNVTVSAGGLTINAGISRTVAGTFQTSAAIALIPTAVLTVNAICQINSGGNFANSAPTYGNVSTLVYNQGGTPSVGNEWINNSTAVGLGVPQNVTIQNSTALTMPSARGMAGDLNISSGGLTLGASGDLQLAGNWTRSSGASFTPAGRTVYFGAGSNATQLVTVSPSGTENFDFLTIQGSSNFKLATNTNVNVNSVNGFTLSSINPTSGLDLNGQTFTITNGGNFTLNNGARNITSTIASGNLVFTTSVLTLVAGTGSLVTDINTIVKLQTGFNCSTAFTVNGTLQIDNNGFCTGNSPKYGSASTLIYNSGASYNRTLEWISNTAVIGTAGYPNNVLITNSTTLNYYNATYTGAKAIYGKLDINAGSALSFGAISTGGALTVPGNVTNAGTITLGVALGDDLKVGGNYANTGAGVFNGNNRAIWFISPNSVVPQTVNSVTALTIPYVVTRGSDAVTPQPSATATTVQLLCNVTISAPLTGAAIVFNNASDVIDINGYSLTIGTSATANTISGSGTFKGSTTSNLTLLGTGSIGTLSFTSGFQNLGTFTMNRQAATIGCVMGSPLTVNTSLVLTNGLIDITTIPNNLTFGATATTSGASSNSYVLAYTTTGGQLIKTFSAPGSFTYPIGDNTSGLDYSPATLTFSGGTYSGTVGVRVVDAVHPSNTGADYLTRYWQVLVTGSITPTNYTFAGTYVAADIVNVESNCLPQCYNGASWTDIANSGLTPGLYTCTVTGTSFPYTTNEFSAQTGSLYYRSKTTGNWNVPGTWETSTDNATWGNAVASPTSSANTITILGPHTVTITADVTIDQVYVSGSLIVSGSPVTATINNGIGTDLTINNGGFVTMAVGTTGGWVATGASVAVLSGGTYIHNSLRAVSAFLDQTVFDTNSTMIYRGATGLTPAVSLGGRTFGHLRFECTSGTITLTPSFSVTTCTSNDFYIGSNVTISSSSLASTAQFVVGGNFTNNGTMNNASGYFNFTFSGTSKTISGSVVPNFDTFNFTGTASYTMNTSVSLQYTVDIGTVAVGATLDNGGENQITGSASATFTVNGKFITRDAQGFTGTNAAIPTLAVTVNTNSTVEYGGPSQTMTAFTTYYNVTISGTGTKTLLTTPIVMNGDLNVNASTLLVNVNEVIEVAKNVNVAGGATFEIKNNGQLVQVVDVVNAANVYVGSNTGNIIYNRTATAIKGYDYVYWASPVTGQDVAAIYSSPSPGFKYFWNPTVSNINTASTGTSGNWQLASGVMTPPKGYIVRGSSSYGMAATSIPAVFTGVPSNGIISTTISRSGNTTASQVGASGATVTNYDDNWNLVGNPYPSAIKATEFLKAVNNPNIQGFINLWTHGTAPVSSTNPFYDTFAANYTSNDYITYNAAGTSSGPSVFNGYIGGGQGFFVSMNDGAAGSSTVNFNNSMRSRAHANNQFYKTTAEIEDEHHRIWVDLVDSNNESVRTLVGYFPEATVGLDRMYDAIKNVANDKSIYSLAESETLIIQGRPTPFDQNDQVPIGVRIMSAGNYKIAIAAVDGLFLDSTQNIYLEDKELNIIYDLRQSPYSFSAVAGKFNDRFVLRYTNTALGNPDFGNINNSVVLATNHGELTIKSSIENIEEVTVYDVLGRQLFFAKAINNNNFVTSNISASQQTLIVKIKLENGMTISRKIIL